MTIYDTSYVGCDRPSGGMTPGLRNIIQAMNECRVAGFRYPFGSGYVVKKIAGSNVMSVHACGRAHDAMLQNVVPVGGSSPSGNVFCSGLYYASAFLGIQEIIHNKRRWSRARGWVAYNGVNPHRDHVHWSINPSANNVSLAEARDAIGNVFCNKGAYQADQAPPSTVVTPGAVISGSDTTGTTAQVPLPAFFPAIDDIPIRPVGTWTIEYGKCGSCVIRGQASSANRPTTYLPVNVKVDGTTVLRKMANIRIGSSTNLFEQYFFNFTPGSAHTINVVMDATKLGFGQIDLGTQVAYIPLCTGNTIDTKLNTSLFSEEAKLLDADNELVDAYTACSGVGLGCPVYSVEFLTMGGLRRVAVPESFITGEYHRLLNDVSSATVTFAGSICGADLSEIQPWAHEMAIYRNDELVWVGPVRDIDYDMQADTVTVNAYDLFSWLDYRFVTRSPEGYYVECHDLSYVFSNIYHEAMRPDPRPGIRMYIESTGTNATREYDAGQYRTAGDELRELARSGVDFTMIHRFLIAGNFEVRGDMLPILTDDAWVVTPNFRITGTNMATRIVVGAGTSGANGYDATGIYPGGSGGTGTAELATYTYPVAQFGLIERLSDEISIQDDCSSVDTDIEKSVDSAARSRWELYSQPMTYIESGQLSESAPVSMSCLVPGRRLQISLSANRSGRNINSYYRLQTVDVTFDTQETVQITVAPLGSINDG